MINSSNCEGGPVAFFPVRCGAVRCGAVLCSSLLWVDSCFVFVFEGGGKEERYGKGREMRLVMSQRQALKPSFEKKTELGIKSSVDALWINSQSLLSR